MLVWLKNMQPINVTPIRTDIPWADIDSAYLVYSLQKSDKHNVPIYNNESKVETENRKSILKICHPEEAFEQNIRGYISTLLPSLQYALWTYNNLTDMVFF